MRLLDSISDLMDMNLRELWELVMHKKAWHAQRVGHDLVTEQLPERCWSCLPWTTF